MLGELALSLQKIKIGTTEAGFAQYLIATDRAANQSGLHMSFLDKGG
jgi:hypothetical protein